MEDVKALKLFQEILTKTRAGRIKWEATARESEYFSVLPGGFIATVQSWHEDDRWGNDVEERALTLRTGDDELLCVTNDVDGVEDAALGELLELARRQALGVNAQVDKLLGELAKL